MELSQSVLTLHPPLMAILEFVLHKNSNINLGNNRRRAKIALSLSLSQKIIALLLSYAVV